MQLLVGSPEVERPAAEWKCGSTFPEEVAGKGDVLPAHRRGVGQKLIRHVFAGVPKMGGGVGHVGRVPPDDGRDHQVEAGNSILLRFMGTIGDAALPEGVERLGQLVPLLALVQTGLAALAKGWVLEPIDRVRSTLPTFK